MRYSGSFTKLAAAGRLSDLLDRRRETLLNEIASLTESYVMQVNEADLIAHLVEKHRIEPPELLLDQQAVVVTEQRIPAERFPSTFHVYAGKSYPQNVVEYTVPGAGELDLLRYQASTFSLGYLPEVHLRPEAIAFEVIAFGNDSDAVNRQQAEVLRSLRSVAQWVRTDVEHFNRALLGEVERAVRDRKSVFAAKHKLLDGLTVPIKNRLGAPQSVSAPVIKPKEKIIPPAPVTPRTPYQPTPALDADAYRRLIDFLFATGKGLERLPSTYAGKLEEDIRDHLLLMLDTQFEGEASATGETFNRSGKTDILVRYQGKNIFAAECKFWKGPKAFKETIDQLLGYLTWRDSKAAVIVFDRNVGFSKDLETIRSAIREHPNYLATVDQGDPSRSVHTFHLDGDRGLIITLTVLVFHFPTHPKTMADIEKKPWLKHELEKYRLRAEERDYVLGSAGSVVAIPDLMRTMPHHPHLVNALDTFMSFALDNHLGEIFEQICAVGGPVNGVRVELKSENT